MNSLRDRFPRKKNKNTKLMQIDIMNSQDIVKIDNARLKRYTSNVLKLLGERDVILSVVLTDDQYIRRLNKTYRGVDRYTDVLAFPIKDSLPILKGHRMLGDIVISVETAKREAKIRHIPFERELVLYLTHGILHLLGYDDTTIAKRKLMSLKQSELLKSICGTRP